MSDTRHTAAIMTGAAFRFVRRRIASLTVWLMPIVVVALTVAGLSGRSSFHQGSGLAHDADQADIDAKQPLYVHSLHYPGDYIKVVKKAHEQGHDVLASSDALESAWKAVSRTRPFALKIVRSPHPQLKTRWAVPPELIVTFVVNETNFANVCPFLEDLRDLILEGDGSGCGRLRRSGYRAQPAEAAENRSGA